MPRFLKKIKEEVVNVGPAVLYFFLAFNLFNLTFGEILLREAGIRLTSIKVTIVASLIVGKVMILVDNLPFLDIFQNKPLVYNTIWKTVLYAFFCYLARTTERFISLLSNYHDAGTAWYHLFHDVTWARFWTVQVWAFILMFIFVVWREIVKGVGKDRLYDLFFGAREKGRA